ncbi:peptidoglycan-associated lipoprotein Pal [Sphingomonas sp. BN140010]|uniref:Peptidoglycan-associated lipoprotein n=1 Tax=Sphingomonas arvum TaxID=2992113 RepID=A0ABT3JB60_9SPHN|nr:peptidoglycan-associated lipoprotein Pal [Sphingomonas sp. BN140010]MCW3796304.1 peptidoglycan-associated lipoprotein Pal [Sphingomonas sp. BN140010]
MRTTLIIAASVLALGVAGCGKKPAPATVAPAATDGQGTVASTNNDDVGLVELPGSQAALVAAAGTDTILFNTDQSDLDDQDRAVLTAQARWLVANPNVRASIEGHADERGTREYNQALGERRANAAKNFLLTQGVPDSRLLVISWGKERPAATGTGEAAWAQNRRAVTVIVR